MLQRNVSGSPLVLPTLDPPAEVLPGDTIEHPELLAGFEEVTDEQSTEDEPAQPAQEDEVERAAPSATTDEEVDDK